MTQQPRQLAGVRPDDDCNRTASHRDAVRDHPVQDGPATQLYELLGLAQASRGASRENQDVKCCGQEC